MSRTLHVLMRIVISALIALALATPAAANTSAALNEALESLRGNTQPSASGSTGSRHYHAGARYRTTFAQGRYSLVNIAPPSFSAGCHGIDAHFGGIDYISGDQIAEMLQQVAQAATGTLIMKAFKQLCPICADAIEWAEAAAQFAAKAAIDTCQLGQWVADGIADRADTAANYVCANLASETGAAQTFRNAASNLCSGDRLQAIEEARDAIGDDQGLQGVYAGITGNGTWLALRDLGYTESSDPRAILFAEMIMSAVGPVVRSHKHPPLIEPADMVNLYLCGSNNHTWGSYPGLSADVVTAIARTIEGEPGVDGEGLCGSRVGQGLRLYYCKDGDYQRCDEVGVYEVADGHPELGGDGSISGGGMAHFVTHDILTAVSRVASNQSIPAQALSTISMSPFPLYRVINTAAVYPDMTASLIGQYSQAIAVLIVSEYMERRFSRGPQSIETEHVTMVADQFVTPIQRVRANVTRQQQEEFVRMDNLHTMHEAMMAQVRQINQSILQGLRDQGIDGLEF